MISNAGFHAEAPAAAIRWHPRRSDWRGPFGRLGDRVGADLHVRHSPDIGFVDGEFTLGENIGDLGGVNVAYHAYRLSLDGKAAPVIDGLTGDQRFFLACKNLLAATGDGAANEPPPSLNNAPPPRRLSSAINILSTSSAIFTSFLAARDSCFALPLPLLPPLAAGGVTGMSLPEA